MLHYIHNTKRLIMVMFSDNILPIAMVIQVSSREKFLTLQLKVRYEMSAQNR